MFLVFVFVGYLPMLSETTSVSMGSRDSQYSNGLRIGRPRFDSVFRGWCNRPASGRRTKLTHSQPTPRNKKKKVYIGITLRRRQKLSEVQHHAKRTRIQWEHHEMKEDVERMKILQLSISCVTLSLYESDSSFRCLHQFYFLSPDATAGKNPAPCDNRQGRELVASYGAMRLQRALLLSAPCAVLSTCCESWRRPCHRAPLSQNWRCVILNRIA